MSLQITADRSFRLAARPGLAILVAVAMMLSGSGALAQDAGGEVGSADPALVQPVPTASERDAAEVEQAETVDASPIGSPAQRAAWMVRIDELFGRYVVGPVASVIFFDFWTGPWTDSDGVEHSGWVGTSIPFVVVWLLAAGVFLTLRMGFINLRAFRHAIQLTRGAYDTPGEPGEVSHFQALAAALSATVGLGNIAGVAIAIGTGGPGACFWIVLVGFLGMTAKFTECTLGQLYRVTDEDGHVLGGPMRYLKFGLAEKGLGGLGSVLAVLFMLLCIGGSLGGGNSFQVGQSLEVIRGEFEWLDANPWFYGLVMVAAVGVVIVGGIKSIGAVAGGIVPFMCLAYMAAALYILAIHYADLPGAVATIFREAFSPQAAYGGFLGVLVIGVKRAVFSNEAGVGSAAIAHSAARTDEPVSEGIVSLLEPFIDTVVVCTITALVVIVTGAYNAPEMVTAIEADQGARVTLYAFTVGGHDWFRYVLYLAVVLFAYSTCISWSYYGERCWSELFGVHTSFLYKILFLTFTFLGSVVTRGNILTFSDLMILGMSFPNLLGVFILSGVVKRRLDDYWGRYQSGSLDLAAGRTPPPEA